ncbi:MAG: hypothetical protein ABL921_22345, partial [Pirellula sp.]
WALMRPMGLTCVRAFGRTDVGLVREANEDSFAREALEELLQEREPELRFGAFLAIRQRNPTDLAVSGEMVGQSFQFMQIPSATPLAVVSLQKKKEVVLFGNSIAVNMSSPVSPTPSMVIMPVPGGQVKLTKTQATGEVYTSIANCDLVSILRSMASIQASYNDVVHTIDVLSKQNALTTPIAMNPRPYAGREYVRKNFSDTTPSNDSILDVVSIDRSSIDTQEKKQFAWLSPTSWFKPSKSPVSKNLASEPSQMISSELSDEELDLLNH